jgi:phosphotransferase system enzyme I (PtsI)
MDQTRKILKGESVSSGIAVAKAYTYEPLELNTCKIAFAKGMEREYLRQFKDTVVKAKEELRGIYEKIAQDSPENAELFLTHQFILEDEDVLKNIQRAIEKDHMYPDTAIEVVFGEYVKNLAAMPDAMFAERAKDLQDIEKRLIRIWQGKKDHNLSELTEEVIVVAHDLLPSDIASMNCEYVKGIITEIGGETSHCAILARCYGIPAILGVKEAVKKIPDETMVGLDALNGQVILRPSQEDLAILEKKRLHLLEMYEGEKQYLDKPGETKDGVEISIGINLGTEAFEVEESWFDYVGLLRTEFLCMDRNSWPTEEEQFEIYKKILEGAKGKVVTLRTFDIGGDKIPSYMEMAKGENPFLGIRGIRFSFRRPEIFMTQIRGALRASAHGKLRIMFPLVENMEDIYKAKAFVRKAMEELDAEGILYDKDIKFGVVIETPSMAMIADLVAEEVDFASIGANDLVQYCCVADRTNLEVSEYYQSYSPAMVRFYAHIIEAFQKKGKTIGVCGELAGNPKGALFMVGLGARWLSMDVSNIASVKAALSHVTLQELRKNAEICKNLRTEQEVKAFLGME